MSIPAAPKLAIDRNRYYALTLPFTVNGAALDVSSWTFAGQVVPEGGTATDMTVDSTSAATGTIIMHLSATQTAALTADTAQVGVDVTISGNKVQILRTTARVSDAVEP